MSRDFVSTRELLNRMGKGTMDATKKALAEGAEAVKTEAKCRCPVYRGRDKCVVPGALQDFSGRIMICLNCRIARASSLAEGI